MAIQFLQQIAIDEISGTLFDAVAEKPLYGGVTTAQIQTLVSGAGNPLTVGITDGIANSTALQAIVSAGGVIKLTTPGVYCLSVPISIPNNTWIDVGLGVILVKTNDPSNACTLFQNSSMSGGNVNIALTGRGTLYFNANAYSAVYAANTADCPVLPSAMLAVLALSVTSSALYTMNGLHFENIKGLKVGGGLRVMMSSKYNIYGASLTDFEFNDIEIYSDDTVNPANGGTYGRDGIHIQGLSENGKITNIRGTVNDDFVALNCRDIDAFVSTRSVGFIQNVVIEKIHGKNQRRSGGGVRLYGGCDTATFSGGKDTCPAITAMSQSGDLVTVTTASGHRMKAGQEFNITLSNPATYNGTNMAVVNVPTSPIDGSGNPTTFTFLTTSGAGAYVGSAVIKRYYMLEGITVRDVDQISYSGPAVGFDSTGDIAADQSVAMNITLENIAGFCYGNPTGSSGVVHMANTRLVNPTFKNIRGRNDSLYPVLNMAVTPATASFGGTARIEGLVGLVPYKPNSSTGDGWVRLPATYDQIEILGGSVTIEDGGGGWRNAISVGGSAAGSVLIDGLTCRATPGNQAHMVRCDAAAMGNVEIRNCSPIGNVVLAHLGGTITSGSIRLSGMSIPARATPLVNWYGIGSTLTFSGMQTGAISGGIINSGSTGAFAVTSDSSNNFSGSVLFGAGSTGGAAAVQVRGGSEIVVDGAAGFVGTNPGNTFWNSNAAFGVGIGYYGRANAGAWIRLY